MLRGSDRRAVHEQLGRAPSVPFTVAASCRVGHPLVIHDGTRGADGSPFPTTFWLTCPDAVRAVSRIESTGAIGELNARIEADPAFAAAVSAAHEEAAAIREEDEPGAGAWGGVGGTARGIKCLHAHYANHLAHGDDAAGRWIAERVEPIHPEAPAGRVVAAIDQGTNSTRLLVLADGDPPVELARDLVITRLGQGVDATGRLHPEALVRVGRVLRRYARRARALGAGRLRVAATSAVRDAANREDFVRTVEETTGVVPEIIGGDREAELSFRGATDGLAPGDGPFAVLDIGGGSTEFVTGPSPGVVDVALSAQIGSVRLTERHLHHDPPTTEELAALDAAIDGILADALAQVPVGGARTFLAVAGTAVTVQAIAMGLEVDDPDLIHRSTLTVADAERVRDRLATMTIAERDALPAMPRGRGEVIVAGAAVLAAVLARTGLPHAVISETDILDGLAFELLRVG